MGPILSDIRSDLHARILAAHRRSPGTVVTSGLIADCQASLDATLTSWCAKTLILDLAVARHSGRLSGDSPERRLQSHLDELASPVGRRRLAREYPLLIADARRLARQTARALAEAVERVANDHSLIFARLAGRGQSPTPLTGIQFGLGDRHQGGRRVSALWFDDFRVIYKPRSLANELGFERFLLELQRLGVGQDLRLPRHLLRRGYGYAEFIPHRRLSHPEQASDYYRRYGELIAIIHIAAATDIHHENIVADGAHPVLIDLETVAQPCRGEVGLGFWRRGPDADTLVHSGMLPIPDAGDGGRDLSGLAHLVGATPASMLIGRGDELRFETVASPYDRSGNLPNYAGRVIPAWQLKAALVAGFEQTYRRLCAMKAMLMRPDGPARFLTRLRPRVVIRRTDAYVRLLQYLSHPDSLRSRSARERILSMLGQQSHSHHGMQRCAVLERQALARLDIPRILAAANGRDAFDHRGHRVGPVFGSSGRSEIRRRIRSLCERDLDRQRHLLDQTIEATRPFEQTLQAPMRSARAADAALVAIDPNDMPNAAIAAAAQLAQRIADLAFSDRSGVHLFQLHVQPGASLRLAQMAPDLYTGLSGLAIFFAELGQFDDHPRYRTFAGRLIATARRIMAAERPALSSIGAFSGLAGWSYALARLAVLWQQEALLDEAESWSAAIAAGSAQDTVFDVIGGSAGALLVLLELDRLRPGGKARDAAFACAQKLLNSACRDSSGRAYWPNPIYDGIGLTGFGHGTAGIAAALAKFGERVDSPPHMQLARDALAYERASFDHVRGVWLDLRPDRHADHAAFTGIDAWCHGGPGIGIGRLMLPNALRDKAWQDDLDRCLLRLRQGAPSANHCLCHGELGNLELLLLNQYTGESPPRRKRCEESASRTEAALRRIVDGLRLGAGPRQIPLGLMAGVAGVGHGLLRLARPDSVASVLSLSLLGHAETSFERSRVPTTNA
ncbi:MAG: type 2 lanthipeptide synthetase LanM family protein [Xanthomonadaceae bacterium]|nr:type 2 lanthipeptide synthetase LanM family protein [Xanthomonadaceae bacterium]